MTLDFLAEVVFASFKGMFNKCVSIYVSIYGMLMINSRIILLYLHTCFLSCTLPFLLSI